MHILSAVFPLGTAALGLALAYWLGALALLRKRRADLIRERLVAVRRLHRPYLAYTSPRFISA